MRFGKWERASVLAARLMLSVVVGEELPLLLLESAEEKVSLAALELEVVEVDCFRRRRRSRSAIGGAWTAGDVVEMCVWLVVGDHQS